jgi:cytochrome P450
MAGAPEPYPAEFSTDMLDVDPAFAAMQRAPPVTHALVNGEPVWVVTGYHETRVVLSDPRFSRSRGVGRNPADSGLRRTNCRGRRGCWSPDRGIYR